MSQEVKLTRYGVAHDLEASPYRRKVLYSSGRGITYVFSSKLYKDIFDRKLEENREKISASLSKRFGFEIQNDILCDIKLYSSVEKRGFYLKTNKKGFTCLDNLRLDGKSLTTKN